MCVRKCPSGSPLHGSMDFIRLASWYNVRIRGSERSWRVFLKREKPKEFTTNCKFHNFTSLFRGNEAGAEWRVCSSKCGGSSWRCGLTAVAHREVLCSLETLQMAKTKGHFIQTQELICIAVMGCPFDSES